MSAPRSLAIYYEHPDWFKPLFAELERRGIDYVRVDAARHGFDPLSGPEYGTDVPLVVNRMSPSAWKRGAARAIPYTLHYLRHLERSRVPVVNGLRAFTVETSKALQLALIRRVGLRAPATRVVHHPEALVTAARELAFPLLVKPNIGGSGAGILRVENVAELTAAVAEDRITPSLDGVLLLQEYHPPRDGSIVRVETLAGRTLYGIRIHMDAGAGFNLCPADVCRTVDGAALETEACPAGAANAGLQVERFDPPAQVRHEVERLAAEASLDLGGIESLESARDGERYYYDINALSNFVADPVRVLGFDPHVQLVDMLVRRASSMRGIPVAA